MKNEKFGAVVLVTFVLALATNESAPLLGVGDTGSTPAAPPAAFGNSSATASASPERRLQQNMCTDCDRLREQRRIVADKTEVFDEGLQLLQRTRREMDRNRSAADGIAAAYTILQSLNIAFGLATLPCSIPQQWLKGLIGGAAGLGAYVQEGDGGQAALAAVVSSAGLGVVSDTISMYEFMQRYRSESEGLTDLRRHVDRRIREFETVRNNLRRERRKLESDLSRGACPFDRLEDVLRPR